MYQRIDTFLPKGPIWRCEVITLPEAPNEPQYLFYRDPIECLKFLAANPTFDGHLTYGPVKFFTDKKCTERVYGEINTGDSWHFYQEIIEPGQTVNLLIFASDATHVTNFSGDGKVHPVYMSTAQIHGDIRNQPNRRAFILVGYIPVCKFQKTEYPNPTKQQNYPGRLQARLFHACLKIIMKTVAGAGRTAVPIINSHGELRINRVFLGAWIADKEEQNIIAALGANSCYCCLAETHDLGNPKPLPVSFPSY